MTRQNIWDNPILPSFKFQKYRAVQEDKSLPYEILAILKNADGTPLANDKYFDSLRIMDEKSQARVDRFLTPLAIRAAFGKKRFPVAINIHLATLCDDGFQAEVMALLADLKIPHQNIMFEIVEPHVPTDIQIEALNKISARINRDTGFKLIIDDHDFDSGHDRLSLLAPYCEMVKIDLPQAEAGVPYLKTHYPHLQIVLERVTFNDREDVFARYPGVVVQGI